MPKYIKMPVAYNTTLTIYRSAIDMWAIRESKISKGKSAK